MDKVRVSTEELKNTLIDNLAAHIDNYDEAMAGYRVATLEKLDDLRSSVEAGEAFEPYIDLIKPESHEDDYETIIAMLEMSVDGTTALTMGEFRSYVEDKWSWQPQFQATANFYSAS